MDETLKGYLSLYEDERVSTETYRLELIKAVGFAIEGFDPNHPFSSVKEPKWAIGYACAPAGWCYERAGLKKFKGKTQPTTQEIADRTGISKNTLNGYFKGRSPIPLEVFATIVDFCFEWIYKPTAVMGLDEEPDGWLENCKEYPKDIPDYEKRRLIVLALLEIKPEELKDREEQIQEQRRKQHDRCADVAYITLIASILAPEQLEWLRNAAMYCAGELELPPEWRGSKTDTHNGRAVADLYEELGKYWSEKTVRNIQTSYVRTTKEERAAGAHARKAVIKTDTITARNYLKLLEHGANNKDLHLLVNLIKALPEKDAAIFSFEDGAFYLGGI